MDMIFQSLMNRLQKGNPRAYQFMNNVMSNGGNPNEILTSMLGNSSPEQREMLIKQAKNYGCPESYLKQIKNFK